MKFALLLLSLPVVVIGCSSNPAVQTGPDAEMTFDGLTRIDNSDADLAWIRADIDLSHYQKIIIEAAGVEFRPVTGPISGSPAATRPESGSSATSSVPTQGEFALSDDQKARFIKTIGDAFVDELSKSERFELVDDPGPDVLLIRGALLDVVSRVPPTTSGRSRIFIDSVGEVTLVLEVRDSVTNAILARVIDRQAARRPSQLVEVNSVTTWSEVSKLAYRWAKRLRVGLESIG